MKSKRNAFCTLLLVFIIGMGSAVFAQPIFENNTPAGFVIADSTKTTRFARSGEISILVDLNEPANATYPVIGNFQTVERAVPFFSSASSAGSMDQAVVIDDNGVIHRAWIQQRGWVQPGVRPLHRPMVSFIPRALTVVGFSPIRFPSQALCVST